MGGINFVSTLDNSDFIKGMEQMRSSLSSVSAAADAQGGAIEAAMGRAARAAAAFGVGFSAVGFVKRVAAVRGEFQQLESSFRTLLGNEQKAADLMEQLTRTAAITPFDLKGVANGAKNLLAYGVEADKVNDKILQLGNLASGLSLNLNDVITLYGTTVSKDAMDTLDVKQFQNRGIAIKQAIADVMRLDEKDGSISAQVDALVTAKKVTPEIFEAAIASMAGASGQFAGMMENQSKTIAGQISNIGDAVDSMFNNIGKQSEGVISGALEGVSYVVENYEEVGKAIAEVVAAYGVYKGVLMSVAAFQAAGARMEIEGLEGLLGALDETADAETAELARKRGLSAEDAERLAHLRAEARQRLALAEAATAQAAQERAAAAQSAAAEDAKLGALRRTEAAMRKHLATREAQLAAERATLTAGQQAARQRELDAIRAQLATNAEAQNTAARARNAAAAAEQAAATRQAAAARQRDTIQAGINTAAVNANSKAAGLLAKAQAALGKAMKSTGLASLANPYVLAAAAVAGLAYGIYKLVTYESDLEKAQRRVNEVFDDATMGAAEEMARLHELTEQMERAEEGSDEYNAARQRIIDQFGQYREGLEGEIGQLTTQSELYRELTAAILDHYMQKAKAQATDEANSKFGETVKEQLKDIKETFDDLQEEEEEGAKRDARALAAIKERYRASYAAVRDAIIKGGLEIDEATGRLRGADIDEGIQAKLVKRISYETGVGAGKEYHNYNTNELVGELAAIREARKLRDAAMEEANAIYGMSAPAKDKGAAGAEAAAKAATEADRRAVAARYSGLLDLIKKIGEAERQLADVQGKARRGETYTQNVAGKETTRTYTDEEVKAAEKSLKELTDAYRALTNTSWEGRDAARQAILDAEAELAETTRKATEDLAKQEEEAQRQLDADRTASQADSIAKRKAQRDQANAKELDDIRKQGEARKKALVDAAKAQHDAEQKVLEAQAKQSGDTRFRPKRFDASAYIASDDYATASADVDAATEARVEAKRQAQAKTGREALQKDLQERASYYVDYINIMTAYSKRIADIEAKVASGSLTEADATIMRNSALMQRNEKLAAGGYDEEGIAQEVAGLEAIADTIVRDKLSQVLAMLQTVEAQLQEARANGGGDEETARLQAEVSTLRERVSQGEKEVDGDDINAKKKKWDAWKKVIGQTLDVMNQVGEMADKNTQRIFGAISQIATGALTVIESVTSLAQNSAVAMTGTATAATEAIKAVEKASVILAIIGAALQIIQAIVSLVKKETTAEKFEKANAQYKEYMNILDTVVEKHIKLAESAQAAAGSSVFETAKGYYEDAMEATKLQEKSARELGKQRANAGASSGSHSYGFRTMNKYVSQEGWQQAAAALGMSISEFRRQLGGRATGLFDMTVEQLEALQMKAPIFLAQMDSGMREKLEDVIKYGSKLSEQEIAKWELLLGHSAESLKEDMMEVFAELGDDGADFAKSFSETLKENILNNAFKNEFAAMFDDIYKMEKNMMSDGVLSPEEYRQLMAATEKVNEDAKKRKEELEKQYGFSEYEAADQEATYGGYETMSEETGSELSGRFSAMYIVQSEHLSTARLMSEQMASVGGLLAAGGGALSDIRALQARANDHLASLVKIAGAIAAWGETIEGIERHTRTLE